MGSPATIFCACAGLLLTSHVRAVTIPFCIKPCVRTEPGFYQCAKNNANDAVHYIVRGQPQKMDVPGLVPLSLDSAQVVVSNSSYSLTLVVGDMTVDGASEVTVDSVRPVFERKTFSLRLVFPKLFLESHYALDGHILQTPIRTDGFMNATIKGLTISYELFMNSVDRDGKSHLEFNPRESSQYMDQGTIYLGGVFTTKTGEDEKALLQKGLGEMIQKFRDLVADKLKSVALKVLNVVASRVPLDQLFPEKTQDLASVESDAACGSGPPPSSGGGGGGGRHPSQSRGASLAFLAVLAHRLSALSTAAA